jgi:hypothetical protein
MVTVKRCQQNMRALEFWLNGKRLCVAAPGEQGLVITSIALFGAVDAPGNPVAHVRVGGVRDEKHLEWLNSRLSLGEVMEVRVVDTAQSDPPASIEPITDAQRERLRIASGENAA